VDVTAPTTTSPSTSPTTSPTGAAQRPGSLRRRVLLLLAAITLVLVAASALAAVSTVRLSRAREHLADRLDPAAIRDAELLAALVDQETGVRGYVLTGDAQFLEPWEAGQIAEADLTTRLVALLDDEPAAVGRLAVVTERAERWRVEFALPAIASDLPEPAEAAEQERGRALFQEVRDAHAALTADVDTARTDARDDLRQAARWLTVSLTALVIALATAIVVIVVELRRSVLRPLATLADDAEVVAGGDLDHVVRADGAAEFLAVATAMDTMRERVVSQLREAEEHRAELARSNAELEQFAYVASHDLQEPLRKVAAFCQMLERRYGDQLDERAHQYIAFAVDGAKRMQELINDLLTFSRVGRSSERVGDVALDDVAARAIANLSHAIQDAGATVRVSPLPDVRGDRTLLVALFQNLVSNAVKFHGDDPPEIDVTVERRGDDWELAVADNGIGIGSQYRERVFVIFQRLHARDDYEGTGIGLAMCRKIVEFHGGRLWIDEDHAGPGTTFRFTLPVHHPEPGDGDDADAAGDGSTDAPTDPGGARSVHEETPA
jgi:signal transduction histidine kinase